MCIISFETVLTLNNDNSSPRELARWLLFIALLLLHCAHVYLKADLSLAQDQEKREHLSSCLACCTRARDMISSFVSIVVA